MQRNKLSSTEIYRFIIVILGYFKVISKYIEEIKMRIILTSQRSENTRLVSQEADSTIPGKKYIPRTPSKIKNRNRSLPVKVKGKL